MKFKIGFKAYEEEKKEDIICSLKETADKLSNTLK